MKVGAFGPALDSPNYIVLAGLPSKKGGRYRYINTLPRAEAPPWMYEVLGRKGDIVRVSNAREAVIELDQPRNIADAIHYLTHEADPAIEGDGGEYRTMLTAMSLHDLGISEEYALELMLTTTTNDASRRGSMMASSRKSRTPMPMPRCDPSEAAPQRPSSSRRSRRTCRTPRSGTPSSTD